MPAKKPKKSQRILGRGEPPDFSELANLVVKGVPGLKKRAGQPTVLKFKSRKNSVYYISFEVRGRKARSHQYREFVVKIFPEKGALERERGILERIASVESRAARHAIGAPAILGSKGNALILEFIKGHNLCDALNVTLDEKYPRMLGKWLAHFHGEFRSQNGEEALLKGDMRLRNFIAPGEADEGKERPRGELVGVDFEDCRNGPVLDDLVGGATSILDTRPGFEDRLYVPVKVRLVSAFLDEYLAST
ncbi:MAG: hypothetical protein ACTSU5_07055, partial [Promethearchaeota archaeon]